MKAIYLCAVLFLAGSVSCDPVVVKSPVLSELVAKAKIDIPDWIGDLIAQLPDSIQQIIDRLPEIIAAIPGILEQIPAIVEQIIDKIPEIIPIILDKLPEIIAQIPALIEKLPQIIQDIIAKLPELIPVIVDKIPEIIEAIPAIIDRIKEIIAGLELPELPSLPEINEAVPGTPASIEEFPGIVQIEFGTGPLWVQICSGSVLTSLHVLSSARCFAGRTYDPRQRRVRAGSSSRYSGGSIANVNYAINHPTFEHFSFDGDITVVRLSTNLVLGATIQQTPIVPEGFNLLAGLAVTVAGWGSTAQGSLRADRDLYQIGLSVSDRSDCAARWGRIPGDLFTITNNMICVARPETGGRNGDVRDLGAPIYYDNILVGIVSLSAPIGNQYFPVVGTSVASYTNWIVANAV